MLKRPGRECGAFADDVVSLDVSKIYIEKNILTLAGVGAWCIEAIYIYTMSIWLIKI